jgi:carboxyl-terminal processing protease
MSPKRHMRKVMMVSALLLVLTLSLGGGVASKSNDPAATYENLRLFTEVLSIVQSQYVDEVPAKDIVYSAIKGTLRGLDPHSSFLDPEMYREMQVETTGSFGGLGIEITLRDDILTVVAPIDGTPAFRAGIQPGDRIVKIEGLSTKDMQLTDAVKRMRGKPGTKITITVVREGWAEPKDFEITREQIQVQSVRNQEIEPGIEYIRLRQFQERTASDMEGALEKFTKNGKIQGLVLDLRNNPGGLLTSAVEVAERFLEPGQLVVYTEGRVRNQNMRFQANARKIYSGFPIVVLVNQGSASASEIVAGALQDWGRGIVLGTTTFGKGSVQTIIPLSDGSGLRLTTAKYFTPKGRSIHGKGVTPDIIVELPKASPATAAAPDAARPEGKGDNGKGEGGKGDPSKPAVEGKPEDIKRDAQLQRALDLLKAMRILDKTRTPTSGPQASK